jgi:hypothetical protein
LKTDLASHGLDLARAVQKSDIEFMRVARRTLICFAPRWVDTWQGSTALLLLQVLLTRTRKKGRLPEKRSQVFTSITDAMETMNREGEG